MKFPAQSTRLRSLEFELFRASKEFGPSHVYVGVSGGADSVALLHLLAAIARRRKLKLTVLHVHHGKRGPRSQVAFRNRAAVLAKRVTKKIASRFETEIEFICLLGDSSSKPESEEVLRDRRFELFANAIAQSHANGANALLALAHHSDDLLETRLIRLLRGTGAKGLQAMYSLTAMPIAQTEARAQGTRIWRPLLTHSREELRQYLAETGLSESVDWVEDPSNSDQKILRNAIRHSVLPAIERARVGGTKSLARSLDLISEETLNAASLDDKPLERADLLKLSMPAQRALLSRWLHVQNVRGFSKSQIEEALKRIDTNQKRLKFDLCGRVWLVGKHIELGAPSQA